MSTLNDYFRPQCMDCRYDLRNLPDPRCPECGRGFDLGDPMTFHDPIYGVIGTTMWGEPSLTGNLIVVAMTLFTVYAASVPFKGLFFEAKLLIVLFVPLFAILAICWLSRMWAVWRSGSFHGRNPHWNTNFKSARWLTFPICVLLFLSCLGDRPWPMIVRFGLSKSAFERSIMTYQSSGKRPGGWIGLYRVDQFFVKREVDGTSSYIFELSHSAFAECGFCHDEHGVEQHEFDIPLGNNWYICVTHF